MIGSRTRSREIALQVLYSCDRETAPDQRLWEGTLADAVLAQRVWRLSRRGSVLSAQRPGDVLAHAHPHENNNAGLVRG